jgi:hypothetical protein
MLCLLLLSAYCDAALVSLHCCCKVSESPGVTMQIVQDNAVTECLPMLLQLLHGAALLPWFDTSVRLNHLV